MSSESLQCQADLLVSTQLQDSSSTGRAAVLCTPATAAREKVVLFRCQLHSNASSRGLGESQSSVRYALLQYLLATPFYHLFDALRLMAPA